VPDTSGQGDAGACDNARACASPMWSPLPLSTELGHRPGPRSAGSPRR
jgi:hypothetical protein